MKKSSTKKFGVALSGGGYRATTYHIGTLRALRDEGALEKIHVMATNSGGSITGAYYSLHANHKSYDQIEAGLREGLKGNVIKRALLHPRCLIGLIFLLGLIAVFIYLLFVKEPLWSLVPLIIFVISVSYFQFIIFPISRGIRAAYDHLFFKNKKMEDLSNRPLLVMNATNVETGKLWSFSRFNMEDYSYKYDVTPPVEFKSEKFPVSRAVNASSCVPFAFNPVSIPKRYYVNPTDAHRVHPMLVDGGLYDNQGIHKLIQKGSRYECDVVLVSDAGAASNWNSRQRNAFSLLLRMMDIFMLRIKNLQMITGVFENTSYEGRRRQIGYFSLSMDPVDTVPYFIGMFKKKQLTTEVIEAHNLTGKEKVPDAELIEQVKTGIHWKKLESIIPTEHELIIARAVSTNLVPLTSEQSEALIKHAYVMGTIFLRLYCPGVINPLVK
jgi:NTE family protein